jgi:hypothetical protein
MRLYSVYVSRLHLLLFREGAFLPTDTTARSRTSSRSRPTERANPLLHSYQQRSSTKLFYRESSFFASGTTDLDKVVPLADRIPFL